MDSIDHISSLVSDIPSWLLILDEQNEQIGSRQSELALLAASDSEQSFSSPRRLKNKGSAESLRPKADDRLTEEDEEEALVLNHENRDTIPGEARKENGALAATGHVRTSSSSHATPQSPRMMQRNMSPSNKKASPSPPIRSSMHSVRSTSRNSQAPSHPAKLEKSNRTRSIIIVYYDSAVQKAFEELVRHISLARNAMRKGKMAERMARMRELAGLENDSSSSDEDEDRGGALAPSTNNANRDIKPSTPNAKLTTDQYQAGTEVFEAVEGKRAAPPALAPLEVDGSEDDEDDEDEEDDKYGLPKLQFKSTTMMGPRRAEIASAQRLSGAAASAPNLPAGMGTEKMRNEEEISVYDELDKSLEWCQLTCERAAHRFLRDGECYTEIAGVRKRLEELGARAEKEVTRAQKAKVEEEEAKKAKGAGSKKGSIRGAGFGSPSGDSGKTRAREMRSPVMRKPLTPVRTFSSPTVLEGSTDAMMMDEKLADSTKPTTGYEWGVGGMLEVDDGSEDEDDSGMDVDPDPPRLIFRSARTGGVVSR